MALHTRYTFWYISVNILCKTMMWTHQIQGFAENTFPTNSARRQFGPIAQIKLVNIIIK